MKYLKLEISFKGYENVYISEKKTFLEPETLFRSKH